MLTIMQRRLDTKTGVNKLFENVFMSGAYSDFFFREGAPKIWFFCLRYEIKISHNVKYYLGNNHFSGTFRI